MAGTTKSAKVMKSIVALASIVLGVWIAMLPPPEGLTPQAMHALGIVVWSVGWWVAQIVPEYVTGLLMCALWVAVKVVPFDKAFYNFSTSGWWIMVGAFGLGAVAGRTGLLKRISLYVISLFPPTFTGQVLGLMGSGAIISPLVPSMNAKAALATPIALAISDSLGIERKTAGAAGLFGACYTGFVLMGHMFLSGSFSHYVLIATMPKEYQNVSWMDWLYRALPWGVVTFVGMAVAILVLFRPKVPVALPKGFGRQQLQSIGPMTRDEKIVLTVLCGALLLWMTESLHGINSGVVAVCAICALLGIGTMTRNDFKNGIEWPAVMFVGSILNMATVISTLKVDKFLAATLKPVLASVLSQPALFVCCLAVGIYLIRFIITSMTSGAVIYCLILAPILPSFGIDPWIVIFISFVAAGLWLLPYTNTIYLCGVVGTKGEMTTHKDMVKLCLAYSVILIIGSLASLPYWHLIGLIK
jgi:divalent anion:Na+ symporter, DASS family